MLVTWSGPSSTRIRAARIGAVHTLAALAVLAAVAVLAASAGAQQTGAATPVDSTAPVVVRGTVYDSLSRAPLSLAEVQLVDPAHASHVYNAISDSTGAFTFPAVPPGRYVAGFFHPVLDALGIEPPLFAVQVAPGHPAVITLAMPGPQAVMAAVCGARAPGDSTGMLTGIVRDADTGAPIAGGRVVVTWQEIVIGKGGLQQVQRRIPVETRDDGGYAICGLPDDRLLASADSGSRQSGVVEVDVPTAGIARRDFSVASPTAAVATRVDSTPGAPGATVLRGTARLVGTVRRPDGKPMSGARVTVWGSGLFATTGADGRFSLAGLPAGTFSAQARAIGYTPVTTSVDLASNQTASTTITLAEPAATTLAPVTVYGKPSAALRGMTDFLQRKREGFGHFLTAADLQNRFAVTDALRMVPGLQVRPTGTGEAVFGRGGCTPAVYVDGMQLPTEPATLQSGGALSPSPGNPPDIDAYVQPTQIMGIEVYTGLGFTPPQYQSNGCGVILIWSKR